MSKSEKISHSETCRMYTDKEYICRLLQASP